MLVFTLSVKTTEQMACRKYVRNTMVISPTGFNLRYYLEGFPEMRDVFQTTDGSRTPQLKLWVKSKIPNCIRKLVCNTTFLKVKLMAHFLLCLNFQLVLISKDLILTVFFIKKVSQRPLSSQGTLVLALCSGTYALIIFLELIVLSKLSKPWPFNRITSVLLMPIIFIVFLQLWVRNELAKLDLCAQDKVLSRRRLNSLTCLLERSQYFNTVRGRMLTIEGIFHSMIMAIIACIVCQSAIFRGPAAATSVAKQPFIFVSAVFASLSVISANYKLTVALKRGKINLVGKVLLAMFTFLGFMTRTISLGLYILPLFTLQQPCLSSQFLTHPIIISTSFPMLLVILLQACLYLMLKRTLPIKTLDYFLQSQFGPPMYLDWEKLLRIRGAKASQIPKCWRNGLRMFLFQMAVFVLQNLLLTIPFFSMRLNTGLNMNPAIASRMNGVIIFYAFANLCVMPTLHY